MEQLDLLGWTPTSPTTRFDERRVRAATFGGRIRRAIAEAMRDCGLSRDVIAVQMSEQLGTPVSKHALDGYASASRHDRIMSVDRFFALLRTTRDRRLLELLAEPLGWAVVERKHLPAIELAAVREHKARVNRHERALCRAVRAIA